MLIDRVMYVLFTEQKVGTVTIFMQFNFRFSLHFPGYSMLFSSNYVVDVCCTNSQMISMLAALFPCFQLLQHLHSENKLSKRFPIGLEEQIKKWDADKIRRFHERWYFPANATLYIVGDVENIPKIEYQIEVYQFPSFYVKLQFLLLSAA